MKMGSNPRSLKYEDQHCKHIANARKIQSQYRIRAVEYESA